MAGAPRVYTGERLIFLNNQALNAPSKFLGNSISTSKYNPVTFLPKFLFGWSPDSGRLNSRRKELTFRFRRAILEIRQPLLPLCRLVSKLLLNQILSAHDSSSSASNKSRPSLQRTSIRRSLPSVSSSSSPLSKSCRKISSVSAFELTNQIAVRIQFCYLLETASVGRGPQLAQDQGARRGPVRRQAVEEHRGRRHCPPRVERLLPRRPRHPLQ